MREKLKSEEVTGCITKIFSLRNHQGDIVRVAGCQHSLPINIGPRSSQGQILAIDYSIPGAGENHPEGLVVLANS